jgi:hypothetical protein
MIFHRYLEHVSTRFRSISETCDESVLHTSVQPVRGVTLRHGFSTGKWPIPAFLSLAKQLEYVDGVR